MGELADGLARVLRRGLPVSPAAVDPALLALRGVSARAIDPGETASRTAALDGILRGLLARLPDARYAPAARALFGLAPAQPGSNLTARRAVAAAAAGHEVHHFRKRVEPRLLDELAAALIADADRFTRAQLAAPRLAPALGREPVGADPFAWEVAEQEEALTRVWSAIYALRAELLAVERLISLDLGDQQVMAHAVTAAWRWARASNAARSYTSAFGPGPGTAEGVSSDRAADELVALAGWTPALTTPDRAAPALTSVLTLEQLHRLRDAAAGEATRAQFVAALHDEVELVDAWITPFLDPTTQISTPTSSSLCTPARSAPHTQEAS
ncbi:hypothetical protein [Pseudonocardia sp. NPDC046786]|uniref:hypothetical protein n=1 Tax=Pseudonocardia sp. NPDC046786 TaxID=3155471 RepID=UPI0033CE6230